MQKPLPEISKQIYPETILGIFEKKYSYIGPAWASLQLEWMNEVYKTFNDYEKFMILVYLRNKTFDFFSKNFVKMSFDEYFIDQKMIQIEKFNVMDVSKNLKIPKESARRKIIELEEIGLIKRSKKQIFLLRNNWKTIKPEDNVKRISRFVSNLAKILNTEGDLTNSFTTNDIINGIKVNFSYVWKLYYDMQIPMLLNYKEIFKDLESFHVNGVCIVNQFLNNKKKDDLDLQRDFYLDKFFKKKHEFKGVSAMSISDITGIPRPTVIRKLNRLIKENFLKIDEKKHYTLAGEHKEKLIKVQKGVLKDLSQFCSKVFNLMTAQKIM